MRTGNVDLSVSLGPELHPLRPSLRCAYRLCTLYGGFEPLARALADGKLSAMADVIETASKRDSNRQAIEATLFASLPAFDHISQTMLAFIFELCTVDEPATEGKATAKAPSNTKPETFPDFYMRLFRIATGWLGWPPEAAWNATPGEIIAAYKGRTELLQAIFGGPSGDDEDATADRFLNAEFDRDGLAALKGLGRL